MDYDSTASAGLVIRDFPWKELFAVFGGLVTIVFFVVKWLAARLEIKEKDARQATDDLGKELHLQRNKLQNMVLEHKVLELKLAGGEKDNEILQLKLNEMKRQHADDIRSRDARLQERENEVRDLTDKVRILTRRVEELTRRLQKHEPDFSSGAG